MTGARRSLFNLARELGMTVRQLEANMTVAELLEWMQYFDKADKPNEIDLAAATPAQLGALFGG